MMTIRFAPLSGQTMFGLHPFELLIVAMIALLLFGKRLPEVLHRRMMHRWNDRSDETPVTFLKATVVVFVDALWYLIWSPS